MKPIARPLKNIMESMLTMANKPETKIVNDIAAFVEDGGGNCLKIYGNAVQRMGEPDLIGGIIIYDNLDRGRAVHFAVEVKLPGEEARPLQKHRLKEWAKVRFVTGVVHSVDEFAELITDDAIMDTSAEDA